MNRKKKVQRKRLKPGCQKLVLPAVRRKAAKKAQVPEKAKEANHNR
jgi:hypothetical protein